MQARKNQVAANETPIFPHACRRALNSRGFVTADGVLAHGLKPMLRLYARHFYPQRESDTPILNPCVTRIKIGCAGLFGARAEAHVTVIRTPFLPSTRKRHPYS